MKPMVYEDCVEEIAAGGAGPVDRLEKVRPFIILLIAVAAMGAALALSQILPIPGR